MYYPGLNGLSNLAAIWSILYNVPFRFSTSDSNIVTLNCRLSSDTSVILTSAALEWRVPPIASILSLRIVLMTNKILYRSKQFLNY